MTLQAYDAILTFGILVLAISLPLLLGRILDWTTKP